MYRSADCQSESEYIEQAIEFYSGYLAVEQNQNYMAHMLTGTLKAIVMEGVNRLSRLLFKLGGRGGDAAECGGCRSADRPSPVGKAAGRVHGGATAHQRLL